MRCSANLRQALSIGHVSEAETILARLKKEIPGAPPRADTNWSLLLTRTGIAEADALAPQLCPPLPGFGPDHISCGTVSITGQKRYEPAEAHFRESLRPIRTGAPVTGLGENSDAGRQFEEAESLLQLSWSKTAHCASGSRVASRGAETIRSGH